MKRSETTYGQLDGVLRSLGFSCHQDASVPPTRVYRHETGALVMLPAFPETDKAFAAHLAAVRAEIDNFGIADPGAFDAALRKAG